MYVATTIATTIRKESMPRAIRSDIFINVLGASHVTDLLLQMTKCVLLGTAETNWWARTVGGSRAVTLSPGWTIALPAGVFTDICIWTPTPRESHLAALGWSLEDWCFSKVPRWFSCTARLTAWSIKAENLSRPRLELGSAACQLCDGQAVS